MKIKVLDNRCILSKGYVTDAGWDLRSRRKYVIAPGETIVVETGVCVEIPEGYSGDVRPRSSVSLQGILVHYGTVDVGFTGEVKVTVTNLNHEREFTIYQYERIAQLVINSIDDDSSLEIVQELNDSARGANGFGSTGRN